MILSKTVVRQYAFEAGFRGSDLDSIVNIAICESGLNTNAHCLNCFGVSEDSRGLWQINLNAHPQYKSVDLFNPKINAEAAYQVYKEAGYSFKPWYNCANKLGILNKPEKKSGNLVLALMISIVLYSLS